MSKSNYLEIALLNFALRANTQGTTGGPASAWTAPSAVYVGLFSDATPSEGGGNTEPGGNYARQQVTFGAPTASGTAYQVTNTAAVTYSAPNFDFTVQSFGIFDAASAGNLLYTNTLSQVSITNGGPDAEFAVGAIVVSES